jgi:SAM-dependent methyltransferase
MSVTSNASKYKTVMTQAFRTHYAEKSDVWSNDHTLIDASVRALELWLQRHQGEKAHVLDIGCGNGRHLPYLKDGLAEYTGLDLIGQPEWSNGRANYPFPVQFVELDFLSWSQPDDQMIELILDNGTFHHQHPDDQQNYLRKVRTLLGPEGMFSMVVWAEPFTDGDIDTFGRYHAHFDEVDLKGLLNAAGLRVIQLNQIRAGIGKQQWHAITTV